MKLLIAGSRGIENFDLSEYVPPETELIISGGAKGIDSVAEKYADEHGIKKIIIRPCYERYGRAAPIKRNEKMVELCDIALIVWDGSSKGTSYTINYASKMGKKVILIEAGINQLKTLNRDK